MIQHHPKIVTGGLVAYYDAGNKKSYTGSGTTWTDLTKNKNNGILLNGTAFSNINNGTLSFDNVNDAVIIPILTSISNSFTISTWVNHSINTNVQRYVTIGNEIGVLRHDGFQATGQLHFYVKTGGSLKHLRVNNQVIGNTWQNFAATWDGTNQILYKNGVQVGSAVPGGSLNAVDASGYIVSSVEWLNGFIPIVQIYNTSLSNSGILQNYIATKGRFGL